MSCGIYKITNQINGKVYIGQSINIERRWRRHKSDVENRDYPIYRAIRKYGLENFYFEIVEETLVSELNEKERYWISFYGSAFSEKGYNLTLGGNSSSGNIISLEDVIEICELLKETTLTNLEIGLEYNVSENMVSGINTGLYWRRDIAYPIRKQYRREVKLCKCGVEISPVSKECTSCYALSRRTTERPSKEDLFLEVRKYGFKETGRHHGVSDNAIRKWCANYGLPTKIKDYK